MRLACYDAWANRDDEAQTAPPGAPANASEMTSEGLFGLPPGPAGARLQQAIGIEAQDTLHARVDTVGRLANGKLRLGLGNGQTWIQLDNAPASLRPGDEIRIERAALGSYLLRKAGSRRSIRVRRVDESR